MSAIARNRLRELFASGGCELDGYHLKFEGSVGQYSAGREELEIALGYRLPEDVAQFLSEFGGTKLFVNEYGLGIRVLRLDEVAAVNKNLQETTAAFWPRFAVIAFDSTDDMLCLYRDGDRVHFGNLHHEAWEAPDLWVQEALAFAPFAAWLEMMVASGETIPDKRMRYAI